MFTQEVLMFNKNKGKEDRIFDMLTNNQQGIDGKFSN